YVSTLQLLSGAESETHSKTTSRSPLNSSGALATHSREGSPKIINALPRNMLGHQVRIHL
ncbi:MAG: hypothetical protein ACE5J6_04310, partial [Candidatus Bathyarchaeia archaeon]